MSHHFSVLLRPMTITTSATRRRRRSRRRGGELGRGGGGKYSSSQLLFFCQQRLYPSWSAPSSLSSSSTILAESVWSAQVFLVKLWSQIMYRFSLLASWMGWESMQLSMSEIQLQAQATPYQ